MIKQWMTAVIVVAVLSSCAGTATMVDDIYSVSEKGESPFDGTKWISVKNIWCDPITFDLYQESNMAQENLILLDLNIGGAHLIKSGESLHLNINGKIHNLKTVDRVNSIETKPGIYSFGRDLNVYIPAYNVTSRRYLISVNLLDSMIDSNHFVMRIDLEKDFIDAVCSSGTNAASTTYGLSRFRSMLQTLTGNVDVIPGSDAAAESAE